MFHHVLGHPFRLGLSTIKLICVGHLTFTHLIEASAVGGPSMLPTFAIWGEWLVFDKTARRGRRVAVGDLVSYKLPFDPCGLGVKRVLGMPGDYVSIAAPGDPGENQVMQVPEGHCWIVGDNLSVSRDSRLFGPLPLALIEGKVVARLLPWKDRQWIGNGLRPADDQS
ncbi:hypothetical protein XA68_11792 [Ophiocordyceps unilateralis]|uniref:Peptidase S26 domain-containing protein n=1 Tax=Ophiocordyceps unilateralis TaxID=268505 RepID=A0A2A9PG20_OPHUN|nr:hypothetical protein XA68_11792 [Ophiocordyceps unilateralis]